MSKTGQVKCSNCGSTRDAEDVFCGNCGERIVSSVFQGNGATTFLKQPNISKPTSVGSSSTIFDQNQTILELTQTTRKRKSKLASYYHTMGLKRVTILVVAIIDLILLLTSFTQSITSLFAQGAILLAVGLFVFIIIQIALLEQWYWFVGFLLANPLLGFAYYLFETTSSIKWLLLVSVLLVSPLIALVYALFGPLKKPRNVITLTDQRHLILITAFIGIAMIIVALIFNIHWGIYTGAAFIFAGHTLTIIQLVQLKQGEWFIYFLFISCFFAFVPLPFLGVAYCLFGPKLDQE